MILSHSVNPVYDTPEVLLDYAKKCKQIYEIGILLQDLRSQFMKCTFLFC